MVWVVCIVLNLSSWVVPRLMVGLSKSDMLFCNYATRYALSRMSVMIQYSKMSPTNRSKHGSNEFVNGVRVHIILHFNNTHNKPGNDRQMLLQGALNNITKSFIILNRANLGYFSEPFKGTIV